MQALSKAASAGLGVVLAITLTGPLASADGGSPLAAYTSCTALNRDYSHGVMKQRFTRAQWTRKGATGKPAYRPKIYKRVQANLDRDNDGIACER